LRSPSHETPRAWERLEAPSLKPQPRFEREPTPPSLPPALLSLPIRFGQPAQWKALALALAMAACVVVTASIHKMCRRSASRHLTEASMAVFDAPVPAPLPVAVPPPSIPPASALPEVRSPTPPPAPSASDLPSATEGHAAIPATEGHVALPASVAGHRIFVDGHVVGEGLRDVRLRCGRHSVRIGSAGTTRRIDVPCGGEVTF
jgi:hypothetical protein